MQANWTRGLYGHRKSGLHWKLTRGEKSLAAPLTRTRVSIASGFSMRRCTNKLFPPLQGYILHGRLISVGDVRHVTRHSGEKGVKRKLLKRHRLSVQSKKNQKNLKVNKSVDSACLPNASKE